MVQLSTMYLKATIFTAVVICGLPSSYFSFNMILSLRTVNINLYLAYCIVEDLLLTQIVVVVLSLVKKFLGCLFSSIRITSSQSIYITIVDLACSNFIDHSQLHTSDRKVMDYY